MTVIDLDAVGLGQGLSRDEIVEGGIVDGVGPADHPCPIAGRGVADDGVECAAIARAGRRDGDGMRIGEVHIGEGDRSGRGQRRGVLAGRSIRQFGDLAGRHRSGNDRRVVGAIDGDGDVLERGPAATVADRDLVGLAQRLAGGQIVDRGVVDGIGPGDDAGSIAGRGIADDSGERAPIARSARRHDDSMRIREIHVSEGHRPGRGQCRGILAGCPVCPFVHRACQNGGVDHGRIVGPGNLHRHRGGVGSAVTIVDGVGEGFGPGLARSQILIRCPGVEDDAGAAGCDADRAQGIAADRDNLDRIPVPIRIIRQHIDCRRAGIFTDRDAVILCVRVVVLDRYLEDGVVVVGIARRAPRAVRLPGGRQILPRDLADCAIRGVAGERRRGLVGTDRRGGVIDAALVLRLLGEERVRAQPIERVGLAVPSDDVTAGIGARDRPGPVAELDNLDRPSEIACPVLVEPVGNQEILDIAEVGGVDRECRG